MQDELLKVSETQESESSYWSTDRINELLRKVDEEGLDYKSVDNPFHDNDPEFKRANVLWEYTPEEILEMKKCAEDVTYFSKYCQVMTDEGLNYIRLRDYQESVLREYQAHRFNVFLAPRQVGKSITSSIILVWYLLFNHDKNAMILANVGDTAEELMDKIKSIIKGLPFFLKPGMLVNNVMSMRFDNNCRILAKTTTKTSGIGFTIHFLYMDEFAHINPNFIEAFFRSTYPTVSSSKVSRIIVTSTPNGMNKFYEIYQGALKGENTFNPIRVDWWQVPGRDEAWKQKEIGNLGSEELFNQEYGNQFLSSSSLLLGSKELKKIKVNESEYTWREIDALHNEDINYENLLWHPKFNLDNTDVPGKKFIFSIDISGGVKGDFTVINIFKVTPLPKAIIERIEEFEDESDFFGLVQVGVFRDNEIKLEELTKLTKILVKNVIGVDRSKLVIEMNFKGELLYDKLSSDDEFYDEVFVFTKHTESARSLKPGIKYNEKNKMKYCELLRSLIRADRILVNDKKWTIPELFTFGLNNSGTYSSQTGHDDVAMTLVNLPSLFDGYDFNQIVGEVFDELDNSYKDLIVRKLEGTVNHSASEDPFSLRNNNYTKESKGYQDFSKLM
jgi:hypothetical protein